MRIRLRAVKGGKATRVPMYLMSVLANHSIYEGRGKQPVHPNHLDQHPAHRNTYSRERNYSQLEGSSAVLSCDPLHRPIVLRGILSGRPYLLLGAC